MSELRIPGTSPTVQIFAKVVAHGQEEDDHWTWGSWQVILIMLNAALGLILFEWAWYKMRHYRKPIKELNELLPAFRRTDAERWSKWKFYPGAVTLLLPRFLFGVGLGMILSIFLCLALIGQPMDKPISGCRRVAIRWGYKFLTFWFQLVTNFNIVTWKRVTHEEMNYYEEWLGPREE